MAQLTKGKTFTSGETVEPADLHQLVDDATVTGIVNADVSATAAIAGSKLADGAITNAKVDAAAAIAGTKVAPAFGAQDITVSTANRSITNTGNFALSFGTNNTERVRINNAGNVGIANASPTEKLDVTGNIKVSGTAEFGGQVSVPFGTVGTPGLSFDGDNDTGLIRPGSNELSFVTGGSQAMRINASNNVGIGVSSIDSSCLLQMASTTKGFRPPIMSTAQRNDISSPATGLIVYNTTTDKINFYNGTSWQAVTSS
jgi:hypothetical protein